MATKLEDATPEQLAKPLTDLEKRYVHHYKLLKNKTKAYIAAGGKSKKHAKNAAWAIHDRPHVQAAVNEDEIIVSEDILKEEGITSETIVSNLKMAYEQAMRSGRFGDAMRAQELLGKHIGMFKDRSDDKKTKQVFLSSFDEENASLTETQQVFIDIMDKLIGGNEW